MPGEAGDYLYAAINQTRFVFAKVMKGVSPYDAADFLEDLRKAAPAVCASKSLRSSITDLRGRRASRTFSKTSRHPFIIIIRVELFDFSTVRPIPEFRRSSPVIIKRSGILRGNYGSRNFLIGSIRSSRPAALARVSARSPHSSIDKTSVNF